ADATDRQRLQDDHAGQAPIADPDRLERAKLFEVLESEEIERLSRDHGAYDQGARDGDPEVDRNAGVLLVITDAVPAEFVGREPAQCGLGLDAACQLHGADAWGGPGDHIR